jgi:hypothetical protein
VHVRALPEAASPGHGRVVKLYRRLPEEIRNQILAGIGLVVALFTGLHLSSTVERGSRARVEALREREVSAADAQRMALARELAFEREEGYFEAELEADFKEFGIAPISLDALKRPNRFFHELEDPVVLSPGDRWHSAHIKIRASIEDVNYHKSGATVSTRHSVATVTNRSSTPIAYFLEAHSADRGHCVARGARFHNAMGLLPGESAEVVVCAGTGAIRLDDLRVLEITPIGHVYVSKVPPVAVGHDPTTSRAHAPAKKVEMCSKVPATRISNLIRAGSSTWQDVADFYSRHSCERFQFFAGYRLATEPIERLPVVEHEGS